MNGKGDARRPAQVDEATLADNWARTFGRGSGRLLAAVRAFDPIAAARAEMTAALREWEALGAPLDP